MPGLNFFKIYPQQKTHLSFLLESKGVKLVDTKVETDAGIEFTYDLYFTETAIERRVKWIKDLQTRFSLADFKSVSYSAVVIVSYEKSVYAISFGASHFFVSKYADFEFGISIASRLLSNYKTKNSREFGGTKTKSIETYSSIGDISFDAGESVNYIKGTPVDVKRWGRNVSCGQSVFLRSRNFSIKEAHKLCLKLDEALTLPVRREIPKSIPVRDPQQIKLLNTKLVDDIKSGNYMISVSQQQLSGVAFLFADQYEFFCVAGSSRFRICENLSLSQVGTMVVQYFKGDYQALLRANVEAHEDGVFSHSRKFIQFVDYVDEENNFYLEEGKWYQFDRNYLNNVRSEVDRIDLDSTPEIRQFDEVTFQSWRALQPDGQKHYRERYLNNILEQRHGFVNLDRSMEEFERLAIEIADLFKAGVLYFVKLGEPQTLGYAIDQATATVKALERTQFQIQINGARQKIAKVSLWLFLERKTKISHISEIKSLIFLMKLANWRKTVLLSGLQAEIRVSYLDKTSPGTSSPPTALTPSAVVPAVVGGPDTTA